MEDLVGPELPAWAEQFFARERAWNRLLRGTGLVTAEEAGKQLTRQWRGDSADGDDQ